MTGKYLRLLDRCIRHPIISVSSAIAVLVIVILVTAGLVMASSISLMLNQIRQIYLLRRVAICRSMKLMLPPEKLRIFFFRHRVFLRFFRGGPGVKAGGGNPRFDNDAPRDMVGRLLIEFTIILHENLPHKYFRISATKCRHSGHSSSGRCPRTRRADGQALQIELSGTNKQNLYAAAEKYVAF